MEALRSRARAPRCIAPDALRRLLAELADGGVLSLGAYSASSNVRRHVQLAASQTNVRCPDLKRIDDSGLMRGAIRLPPFAERLHAMILQLLKDATRERHLALEHQMPLLDEKLLPTTYLHMVQKLFTYHKPFEELLLASPGFEELGFDYAERGKTARLAADLAALGSSASDIAQLPQCEHLPDLSTPSHVFGCVYVLEGATLGGQIVARHLLASLGLTPECGASYFSGYGVNTGPQWKAFCALLTAYAARTDDTTDILAGANATYATLSAWMHVADGESAPRTLAGSAAQPMLA